MKTITKISIFIVFSLIATFSYAEELVVNGNFESGVAPWVGNAANVVTENGNSYNAANITTAGNAWDVNLSQVLSLNAGQTYRLKFDAWSDVNRILTVGIGLNEAPWSSFIKKVTLNTTSQTFTLTLVAPTTSTNGRVLFDMGAAVGFVGIDNVSLIAVEPSCSDGVQNGDETGVDCGGTCSPCAVAAPTTAAPTPPDRPAIDVVSVFSGAYSNIFVNAWGPDWGPSSSRIDDVTIATNATKVMKLNAGQEFAGIDFAPSLFDATPFTHFHMDYWIANPLPTGQVLNIKLSNHKGGSSGETNAIIYTHPVNQRESWVSLDIPLANFVYAGGSPEGILDRTAIAQIVIAASRADVNVPVDIYMDNIYFHKNTVTGINDNNVLEFSIYPNPVNDVFYIKSSASIQEVCIKNLLGQTVKTFNVNRTDKLINVKDLPVGNYLTIIRYADGTFSMRKIIKQ